MIKYDRSTNTSMADVREALVKDPRLPYVSPDIGDASLVRPFQPEILPEHQWVGIADLEIVEALTDGLNISFPQDAVSQAQIQLLHAVHRAFGDQMAVVASEDLRAGITGLTELVVGNDPSVLVVTFDTMYAPTHPSINVTRLISPDTKDILGQGPRPGFPPVSQQIEAIKAAYPDIQEVVLADDVLFSASTTNGAAQKFRDHGFVVRTMIVGVARAESIEMLETRGITVQPLIVAPAPVDIVDIKDKVPAIPLGGRQIGAVSVDGFVPLLDENGVSFRIPYVLPHGNPVEWASIPPAYAQEISTTGWQSAGVIFRAIENELGRPVTIGDLRRAKRPTGFPGPPPQRMRNGVLEPEYPVIRVLSHYHKKLTGMRLE